jgi:hypothetical protein
MVISGFCSKVAEICALLSYYAVSSFGTTYWSHPLGSRLPDAWCLRVGLTGCPETSVRNYHHSFIHSTGMCRMRRFLAVLRSVFHSSLLYTFPCHPSPPTILPSSFTSSYHLFLGLPLNLVVSKFIYNPLLGILFSSSLCTCPNNHNLFSLIVYIIVGFLITA